jgi:hypothetical protein
LAFARKRSTEVDCGPAHGAEKNNAVFAVVTCNKKTAVGTGCLPRLRDNLPGVGALARCHQSAYGPMSVRRNRVCHGRGGTGSVRARGAYRNHTRLLFP